MSKGGTSKVVIIGTWGLPRLWHYVEYVVPKIPGKVCGRPSDYVFDDNSVRGYSYSSTPMVHDALRRNLNNAEVRVIIVGQDTVITKCDGSRQGGSSSSTQPSCIGPNNTDYNAKVNADKDVCILNEGLYNEIIKQQGRISYREILKRAEEVIRKYADVFLRSRKIDYDVIIVPGAGDFSRFGYRFESSLENAKFVLMNMLYEKLRSELPDAVILDITHGVNYLPAMTISALSEAVKALYVTYGKPRCLLIVNSDPVNEDCATSRMNIGDALDLDREGLTFNEALRNIGAFEGTTVSMQLKPNVTNIDELKRIKSNDGRIRDLSSKLVDKVGTALEYGALLYVAEKLRSSDFEEFKQLVINMV
jgi:CRISPR-associated protein Csx1